MGRESSIILAGTWSFRYQSSLFWDKSWQPSMWGWASFASGETSQVVQSYLKSLASFFKSPYATTHDFWAEGQHTSRGGGQGASLFWHKGKWLWQQLGGSRRNSRDPPLPQLKYCSHNSSNCRFIWAKNVLLLKFKYSPEGIRPTLKCKIPQHYLCWVAEALGPLSSWNGPRDAGKEADASPPSSGTRTSEMLVSFSFYLDPRAGLKFPQLWDLRKEEVLAASELSFCFGNMV